MNAPLDLQRLPGVIDAAIRLTGNEVILLKGSRGVALERLLPRFEAKWGSLHPHGEAFGSRANDSFTALRDDAQTAERRTHGAPLPAAIRGGGILARRWPPLRA